MIELEIYVGEQADWVLQISALDGSPATTFVASDTLQLNVWEGQQQNVIISTPVIWYQAVTTLTVLTGGNTYSANPTVTISGGGATSSATAYAIVTGGVITSLVITDGGTGYDGSPINVLITDGTGTGATATATPTLGWQTGLTAPSVTAAQSGTLTVGGTYRFQIVATRGSLSSVVIDCLLKALATPGTVTPAPPDLITYDYAESYCEILGLTPAQTDLLPAIVSSVSAVWRKVCKREFTQANFVETCEVELDGYCRVKQIPVNAIFWIKNLPDLALTVVNTTAQQAYIGWTTTGDLTGGQTITGMTATDVINGVATPRTVAYSANETLATLATAITALGNGWTASVNGLYGSWPVTEIYDGAIAKGAVAQDTPGGGATFFVFSSVVTNAYFHPDDGQRTGLICVGQQYQDLSPRWGPGFDQFASQGTDVGLVKISYNGGFATVPQAVQVAVAEHVKYVMAMANTDLLLKSETANKYSYDLATDCIEFLPRHVRQIMKLYTIVNA